MDVLVRSRWIRFLAAFFSGTGRKWIWNLVSSVGTRPISLWVSSSISQFSALAQKRARRSGSFASKQRAASCEVIPLSVIGPAESRRPCKFPPEQHYSLAHALGHAVRLSLPRPHPVPASIAPRDSPVSSSATPGSSPRARTNGQTTTTTSAPAPRPGQQTRSSAGSTATPPDPRPNGVGPLYIPAPTVEEGPYRPDTERSVAPWCGPHRVQLGRRLDRVHSANRRDAAFDLRSPR